MNSKKLATDRLCPHCKNPTSWENNPHRPFCTSRCKTIDFGAWANESYTIPVQEEDFGEEKTFETH